MWTRYAAYERSTDRPVHEIRDSAPHSGEDELATCLTPPAERALLDAHSSDHV